ncbi:hypothetical protein [Botrimarina sp.]|uniref:hypothetical protein n=1 Tax=Botrimarina sp. TaxID=2795802 RepID=UPI0032EE39C1
MSPTAATRRRRRGVTLLEVTLALSMCAAVMTSSFVVLRSSGAAWRVHDAELRTSGQAAALLRHLVQHVRQCPSVTAVSGADDPSGSLTVLRADGATLTWDHAAAGVTLSLNGAAPQPLADEIQTLRFEGLAADGATPAADPSEVRLVRASATVARPSGATRTLSTHIWLRSW